METQGPHSIFLKNVAVRAARQSAAHALFYPNPNCAIYNQLAAPPSREIDVPVGREKLDRYRYSALPCRVPDHVSFPLLAGGSLEIQSGNRPRIVAKAGTTGCGHASRRVFDLQPRYRWGSAVWCPARQRCALAARFLQ